MVIWADLMLIELGSFAQSLLRIETHPEQATEFKSKTPLRERVSLFDFYFINISNKGLKTPRDLIIVERFKMKFFPSVKPI